MRKLIAILLLCKFPGYAALNSTVQWDVRTTGSDSNSGGFDPGVSVPGTDYSQQNSPQISYTDLVVGATTSTYTSVLNPVSSALPGNTLVITGGTGCTTGIYEVLSNATITATVDRSLGTAASVCTAVLGGSDATVCSSYSSGNCQAGALRAAVNGNTIWIKSGTYSSSVSLNTVNQASIVVDVTYEGYGTAHADFGTRPVIVTTGGNNTWENYGKSTFINLVIQPTNFCFDMSKSSSAQLFTYLVKCDVSANSGGGGIYNQNSGAGFIWGVLVNTEFSLNSTAYGVEDLGGNFNHLVALWDYFHGGAAGVWDGNNSNAQLWLIRNCTFASNSRGVYQQASDNSYVELVGNNFYSQTNQNVYLNAAGLPYVTAANNIFYGGTYGIFINGTPLISISQSNAYGNLSTANYSGWVAGINSSDIALSANPFTAPSSANFALNSTSGGGAALKAAGFPGVTPFGTGYAAVGALQPQASSGGGAGFWIQ